MESLFRTAKYRPEFPAQRHAGLDRPILAGRHALYLAARERHPRRGSRHTRNWSPIDVVTLNPERETVAGAVENGMNEANQAAWLRRQLS